jgi:alkaline phosphatase
MNMSLNKRKSRHIGLVLGVILIIAFVTVSTGFTAAPTKVAPLARNVIVLVPDGMNATAVTLTRWYQGSPLTMDQILTGAVKTYAANSLITDSAPAATAFATGFKSNAGFISVLPSVIDVPKTVTVSDADKFRPVATVLEAAKLLGKATGLIATSNIQHATPAGYSAHWPNRNDFNEIGEQQVYQGIDVVFGGGKQYLLPVNQGGKREDNENLIEVLKGMGYDFVENTVDMNNSKASKIWGMFANDAMAYDFDRNPEKEPSLAEMTRKALSILSKNPKGFFLFVEGSKVDWAAHANDPIGVISDVLAFDAAVKVALDYAKTNKNTLVLAFTDHSTGGMSIGNTQTNSGYDNLKLSKVIDPLKKANLTGEGVEKQLNPDKSNIADVMNSRYGVSDLTSEEIKSIKNAKPGSLNYVVGPILSKRSSIGWTTTGHNGEDIFLYAYGPGKPTGLIDNTEIARIIERNMLRN